ncbi:MAG: MBL fold metallo-hydrolase [Gemmatimonadota bacterium]|nr:MAG: MBL fold metallo-hydrolase [Gemmatimonadota bacterium]
MDFEERDGVAVQPGGRWLKTVVAGNPGPLTLDGTRTYLLGGDPCVVVDPGPDLADHLDALEVGLGAAELGAICITHHHADHAAGAAELALRSGALLAALPESAELAGLEPPEIPLSPGASVVFGGGHLDVIPAPGHCPDHVCFHWPEAGALFTGDTILGEGSSLIAPPDGDVAAYLSTLERLAQLELTVIYPGHGPLIDEPAEKIDEYIKHRLLREMQVLEALTAGADTPAQIRARVYPDLDARLLSAAEGSVLAHLTKLMSEGRVRTADDRYLPVG